MSDPVCVHHFTIIHLFVGPSDDVENFQHDLRGVTPRSFEYLFNLISEQQEKVGGVECYYVREYQNSIVLSKCYM